MVENLAKSVNAKSKDKPTPSKEDWKMSSKTKEKGDVSEARALFEFQKLGIPVLLPWGDNLRYDMVIEINGHLYKVQVKTANEVKHGSVKCYTRSSKNHTTNKRYDTYENDTDYFVFYNQEMDKLALVPISEIKKQKSFSLRVEEPLNNQGNVRYFDDYSFEKILCVETLHEEPKS